MAQEPRWRCVSLRRRDIAWPSGGEDRKGNYAPKLTKAEAMLFLRAIVDGADPKALADELGVKSFSVTFRKTPFDHRGRRAKHSIWTTDVFVNLNPCEDADRFRGPLDGLPPEAFKGF